MREVIVFDDACVDFPDFTLGPLNLRIGPGLHALVGPNGSGKSTLLAVVLGFQRITSGAGSALGETVVGRNPSQLARMGYVADGSEELLGELTPEEFWRLIANVRCPAAASPQSLITAAGQLAERLHFNPPSRPISQLSLGMRKKTQIVAALMHAPELLILDEPQNGLDPLSISLLEVLIAEQREAGSCILVASHDLWWAERNCDSVHILANGSVAASGSPASLKQEGEDNLRQAFMRIIGLAS